MKSDKEEYMSEMEKKEFAAEWNVVTGYLMKDDERIKLGLEQVAEVRKQRRHKAMKIMESGI